MYREAETEYVPGEADFVTTTNEYGEQFEVVEFVRGSQPDNLLKLSLIRKVSPDGFFIAGRGWIPLIPNSFGLPPGETCPGKTEFCKACYAVNATNNKGVKELLDSNYELLRSFKTEDEMTAYLTEVVGRYYSFAKKKNVSPEDMLFRIHWSGDFYSLMYAQAWARTVKQFPDVLFLAYTRSFREPVDVVPELDGIDNLVLRLSVDEGNIDDVPEEYEHLRRSPSAKDVVSAERLIRSDRKTIVCPENLGRIDLMQDAKGACIICRACFEREVDVAFVTSGRYDATPRSRNGLDIEEKPVAIVSTPVRINRDRYIINRAIDD